MRNTLLAIFMAMLLAVPAAAGGNSVIYGIVKGEDSSAPLVGVKVSVIGEATYTNRATTTNAKGIYFFTDLPADEYIVEALAQPGGVFKPERHNVLLKKNREKEVNFILKKR